MKSWLGYVATACVLILGLILWLFVDVTNDITIHIRPQWIAHAHAEGKT